jgi:hypothetical protein
MEEAVAIVPFNWSLRQRVLPFDFAVIEPRLFRHCVSSFANRAILFCTCVQLHQLLRIRAGVRFES